MVLRKLVDPIHVSKGIIPEAATGLQAATYQASVDMSAQARTQNLVSCLQEMMRNGLDSQRVKLYNANGMAESAGSLWVFEQRSLGGPMGVKASFQKFRWRLQNIVAPGLRDSQEVYENILTSSVGSHTTWLDLGCGHQVLPAWRAEQETRLVQSCKLVVGIDYCQSSLQKHRSISKKVCGNISRLPFLADVFDLLSSNMVVEHVDNPDALFAEAHRVLKPGGVFLLHTPNALGYMALAGRLVPEWLKNRLLRHLQDRVESDTFKTYYKANSRKRVREVAERNGFEVVELRMLPTSPFFAIVPPLLLVELLWIRLLMTRPFAAIRTNIIAVLKKCEE